ncbi:MAG TPA: hypothetical protein VIJ83_00045 [Solirubrobacteraceae bacterium]
MGKYLLAYRGGTMAATDEEREAAMAAWGQWLGGLGGSLVDAGNPFASSAAIDGSGGVADGASSGLTGYSILEASSLGEASDLTKGCPIFSGGGSVDVFETLAVM